MNWERLREKIIEENYPSEDDLEEIEQKYREISEFIESEFGLDTHFAGSAGRGTCMKDDCDIDIFVLFPEDVDRQELEERGLEIGSRTFDEFDGKHHVEYAEHPYVKGRIEGFEVEIVPCYDTDPENIKSSVDRTPHHSEWADENLDEEQKRDVVLMKKFLDSKGIYGSSLKVRGFSGYLCEILISEYGSFRNLVDQAENWDHGKVLDPESHHETLSEELENKFSEDSLIVIDPVDPDRNVSAVLSDENYARFVYSCWNFNQKPGVDHFRRKEKEFTDFEIKQELKKRADFLVLEMEEIDEVEDIVYPQMRKTLRRLESELEKRDFWIYEKGFHVGNVIRIFFELDRKLPDSEDIMGPRVFHGSDHLEQFTSKYSNVYVDGDRLAAKTDREFTDAKEFLQEFILSGNLEQKGIPGRVSEKMIDFSFENPMDGGSEWFNYLGEKLKIDTEGEKNNG